MIAPLHIGYKENDGGKSIAGLTSVVGDCLVRAIAIVRGLPYMWIYPTVAEMMERNGYPRTADAEVLKHAPPVKSGQLTLLEVQDQCMRHFGFRRMCFLPSVRPTYTEAYRKYGSCVVAMEEYHHLAALKDGALQDTFDSRTYKCEEAIVESRSRHVWTP